MTTLTKGKHGWKAEDLIDFNADEYQKLCVSTYKYGNELITRASVSTHRADGIVQHAFGLAGGGDYSERVIVTTARCTEKAVAAQHAEAMKQLDAVLERARAHYAKVKA